MMRPLINLISRFGFFLAVSCPFAAIRAHEMPLIEQNFPDARELMGERCFCLMSKSEDEPVRIFNQCQSQEQGYRGIFIHCRQKDTGSPLKASYQEAKDDYYFLKKEDTFCQPCSPKINLDDRRCEGERAGCH